MAERLFSKRELIELSGMDFNGQTASARFGWLHSAVKVSRGVRPKYTRNETLAAALAKRVGRAKVRHQVAHGQLLTDIARIQHRAIWP